MVIPDHVVGLPVLRTISLCTCCRHYPGAAPGRRLRSSHPAVSAFPERVVGSACTSAFSRLARRSLALRPAHSRRHLYVTCYTEGSSHFVTSMTAPVASGWSVSPGGTCTHWKAPPFTAHTLSCPSSWSYERAERALLRSKAERDERAISGLGDDEVVPRDGGSFRQIWFRPSQLDDFEHAGTGTCVSVPLAGGHKWAKTGN